MCIRDRASSMLVMLWCELLLQRAAAELWGRRLCLAAFEGDIIHCVCCCCCRWWVCCWCWDNVRDNEMTEVAIELTVLYRFKLSITLKSWLLLSFEGTLTGCCVSCVCCNLCSKSFSTDSRYSTSSIVLAPVSYTHLDVYKRQAKASWEEPY